MNPDFTTPSPSDPHRIHLIKFLIDCTGMSIPEAQQAYEMVKATQLIVGEPKALFKEAIKTFVKGKIFLNS